MHHGSLHFGTMSASVFVCLGLFSFPLDVICRQFSVIAGFLVIFYTISLRKHTYSNILKVLQPKMENFPIKTLIFFIFLLKT